MANTNRPDFGGSDRGDYRKYTFILCASAVLLLLFSLWFDESFGRISGLLSDVATGLLASAIVVYFVERRVSQAEVERDSAMLGVFSKMAKDSISDLLALYCDMVWAGSFDRPQEVSMMVTLSKHDLEDTFKRLDAKHGGPDCSDSVWASPLIGYIHNNLSTKINSLSRCVDRYVVYIPNDLLSAVEAVISSKVVGMTSDISGVLSKSMEDRYPYLGLIDVVVAQEFPLAKPCAQHAQAVFRLAKCFNSYFSGELKDTTWWSLPNANNIDIRTNNHGYAILKSKRDTFDSVAQVRPTGAS